MAGLALDITASILCPHGGQVVISGANTKVTANHLPLVLSTDSMTVVGCAFTLPGPTPSPCVSVKWAAGDLRVAVNGAPTLSMSSVGICYSADNIPQGPAIIQNTQAVVSTQ